VFITAQSRYSLGLRSRFPAAALPAWLAPRCVTRWSGQVSTVKQTSPDAATVCPARYCTPSAQSPAIYWTVACMHHKYCTLYACNVYSSSSVHGRRRDWTCIIMTPRRVAAGPRGNDVWLASCGAAMPGSPAAAQRCPVRVPRRNVGRVREGLAASLRLARRAAVVMLVSREAAAMVDVARSFGPSDLYFLLVICGCLSVARCNKRQEN
jgi:hypothetical protein